MARPVFRFFGQFLVHHKEVTNSQLDEALELMSSHNRRLGALAIEAGFIDEATTKQVLVEQENEAGAARPFGELLVEKGHLTTGQLNDLLRRQHSRHVRIGEALERLGHMKPDRKAALLSAYHAQLTRSIDKASTGIRDPFLKWVVDTLPRVMPRVEGKPVALAQRPWEIGPREFPLRTSLDFEILGNDGGHASVGLAADPLQARTLAQGVLGVPGQRLDERQITGAWRLVLELLARKASSKGRRETPTGPTRLGLPDHTIAFDLITPDGSGALVLSRD